MSVYRFSRSGSEEYSVQSSRASTSSKQQRTLQTMKVQPAACAGRASSVPDQRHPTSIRASSLGPGGRLHENLLTFTRIYSKEKIRSFQRSYLVRNLGRGAEGGEPRAALRVLRELAARAGEAAVRAGRGARHPSLDARLRTDTIFSTPSNPVQVEGEERT